MFDTIPFRHDKKCMIVTAGDGKHESGDGPVVLFAFDDHSMPWRYRVRLDMHQPRKFAGNPILSRGEAGSVDARRLQCCPVVYADGKYRMWYVARDDGDSAAPARLPSSPANGYIKDGVHPDVIRAYDTGRTCYAESDDGFHWTKPNLGLVEYKGRTKNNIVDIQPGSGSMDILFQPDGPPERRYLMVIEFMGWRRRKGPRPGVDVGPRLESKHSQRLPNHAAGPDGQYR